MAKSYSRNTRKRMGVNTAGGGSGAQGGGGRTDGEEVGGVGVGYNTVLNERQNKSLNRNAGPERPMANKGMIRNVGQGIRKTGRVS